MCVFFNKYFIFFHRKIEDFVFNFVQFFSLFLNIYRFFFFSFSIGNNIIIILFFFTTIENLS